MTQLTHVAGEPDEFAPAGPATLSTIAPTTASPASPAEDEQRAVDPRAASGEHQHHRDGIGLSATPIARASDPPIACPTGRA
ncbi:MAG: hypothetical protein ACRDP7_25295 [Trebonia sp.]